MFGCDPGRHGDRVGQNEIGVLPGLQRTIEHVLDMRPDHLVPVPEEGTGAGKAAPLFGLPHPVGDRKAGRAGRAEPIPGDHAMVVTG